MDTNSNLMEQLKTFASQMVDEDTENNVSFDEFLDKFIDDYIESIENYLNGVRMEDSDKYLFDYLGVSSELEEKEKWINAGCRPLPDIFYQTLREFREVEMKLVINSKKRDYLLEEMKKIEQEDNTYNFPVQQKTISLMEELMEEWRREGETMDEQDP